MQLDFLRSLRLDLAHPLVRRLPQPAALLLELAEPALVVLLAFAQLLGFDL